MELWLSGRTPNQEPTGCAFWIPTAIGEPSNNAALADTTSTSRYKPAFPRKAGRQLAQKFTIRSRVSLKRHCCRKFKNLREKCWEMSKRLTLNGKCLIKYFSINQSFVFKYFWLFKWSSWIFSRNIADVFPSPAYNCCVSHPKRQCWTTDEKLPIQLRPQLFPSFFNHSLSQETLFDSNFIVVLTFSGQKHICLLSMASSRPKGLKVNEAKWKTFRWKI